jgi:hypothetical protein
MHIVRLRLMNELKVSFCQILFFGVMFYQDLFRSNLIIYAGNIVLLTW